MPAKSSCKVCQLGLDGGDLCPRHSRPVHAMGFGPVHGMTVCCCSATRRNVNVSFRGSNHTRPVTCRECLAIMRQAATLEAFQAGRGIV